MDAEQKVSIAMACEAAFDAAIEICNQSPRFKTKRVDKTARRIEGKVPNGSFNCLTALQFEALSATQTQVIVQVRPTMRLAWGPLWRKALTKIVADQVAWISELPTARADMAKAGQSQQVEPTQVERREVPQNRPEENSIKHPLKVAMLWVGIPMLLAVPLAFVLISMEDSSTTSGARVTRTDYQTVAGDLVNGRWYCRAGGGGFPIVISFSSNGRYIMTPTLSGGQAIMEQQSRGGWLLDERSGIVTLAEGNAIVGRGRVSGNSLDFAGGCSHYPNNLY